MSWDEDAFQSTPLSIERSDVAHWPLRQRTLFQSTPLSIERSDGVLDAALTTTIWFQSTPLSIERSDAGLRKGRVRLRVSIHAPLHREERRIPKLRTADLLMFQSTPLSIERSDDRQQPL